VFINRDKECFDWLKGAERNIYIYIFIYLFIYLFIYKKEKKRKTII